MNTSLTRWHSRRDSTSPTWNGIWVDPQDPNYIVDGGQQITSNGVDYPGADKGGSDGLGAARDGRA